MKVFGRQFDTFEVIFNSILSAWAVVGASLILAAGIRNMHWWDGLIVVAVGALLAYYPWLKK